MYVCVVNLTNFNFEVHGRRERKDRHDTCVHLFEFQTMMLTHDTAAPPISPLSPVPKLFKVLRRVSI